VTASDLAGQLGMQPEALQRTVQGAIGDAAGVPALSTIR
jgi:hypothetical protein